MNCTHCLKLVDAFIDEEVDADTAASMREHVTRCTACGAAVEERRLLTVLVRGARDGESVPVEVRERLRARLGAASPVGLAQRRPTWIQALGLAAGVAALAVAATLVFVEGSTRRDQMLGQLVDRHVAALASVPAGGSPVVQFAAQERHQLKPWFQGRVALSPAVVDLSAQGAELLGGRVDRLASGDAAVVVYRVRRHPIDLFAWRDAAEAAPRTETLHGFNIVRWSSGGLAYAAVSDLNAAELERFARAVIDAR
jgi:anti-sigma factor RsiW